VRTRRAVAAAAFLIAVASTAEAAEPALSAASRAPVTVSPAEGNARSSFIVRVNRGHCGDPDVIGEGCGLVVRGPEGSACEVLWSSQGLAEVGGGDLFTFGFAERARGRSRGEYLRLDAASGRTTWCPGRYEVSFADSQGELPPAIFCIRGRSCAPPPRDCRVAGGKIALQAGDVSLWQTPRQPAGLYGCIGRNRPRFLDQGASAQDVAGSWVAWFSVFSYGGFTSYTVGARDLASNAQILIRLANGASAPRVVIDARGRLAYATSKTVVIATSAQTTTIVEGRTIDPESLALAGHTLYWLQDGIARSYDLEMSAAQVPAT